MVHTSLYGAFLRLTGVPCTVVGGGKVAERKVGKLLDSGAIVRVISANLTETLRTWAESGRVQHLARPFQPGDTAGAQLTIAATDDPRVNRQVAEEVSARNGWVNVVDSPELCTFMVPAAWSAGDLQVAISTGGVSPATAKRLRVALAEDVLSDKGRFVRAVQSFLNEEDQSCDRTPQP